MFKCKKNDSESVQFHFVHISYHLLCYYTYTFNRTCTIIKSIYQLLVITQGALLKQHISTYWTHQKLKIKVTLTTIAKYSNFTLFHLFRKISYEISKNLCKNAISQKIQYNLRNIIIQYFCCKFSILIFTLNSSIVLILL